MISALRIPSATHVYATDAEVCEGKAFIYAASLAAKIKENRAENTCVVIVKETALKEK